MICRFAVIALPDNDHIHVKLIWIIFLSLIKNNTFAGIIKK